MRKITAAALVSASAAAAAVGLGSTPAFAATWTVTGSTGAGGAYSASAGTTTLKDTNSGTVLTCSTSSASGVLADGSYATGDGIGSITSSSFNSCKGPLGLTFTVKQNGTWNINAVQPDATAGVTDGTITGVNATLSGPGCSATVTGGVAGTYTNGSAVLAVGPTAPNPGGVSLTISGVSGCLGLIGNGHTATFTASYNVTPNTIAINTP
jgi:hypothetical protein